VTREDRTLVNRVAERLQEGPVHTLDLAREVFGLSGNPGAASAAVFTLLGSDTRFHVDRDGLWTLVGPAPGLPLGRLPYAVVDVETTGGPFGGGHRMTEIAIYEVREGIVEDEYHTLLNPGRSIPSRVAVLTGISDGMVANAPFFDQVADEVYERLDGRVFVAHNVRFDWGFVARQLAEAVGQVPNVQQLCTVRLARRLIPKLRHRNLDTLTAHFGIPIEARHRAYGDALATARVLIRLLDLAGQQGLHDLEALKAFLRRKKHARPRQGQQLSLLDPG
jgi:DNA polymerase-3 subunit epsilon